ncbi:hypothetical protein BI380_21950 [Delftia tsuruhatensis]|uniref:Transposase n=1 Tax=Delftia tsuruhatensis TaxID=180282 RepID=A0ABN4SJR5_9BURK|nr:hypothetical protein BI380_21950 [Delftia tsuruhatensis]
MVPAAQAWRLRMRGCTSAGAARICRAMRHAGVACTTARKSLACTIDSMGVICAVRRAARTGGAFASRTESPVA